MKTAAEFIAGFEGFAQRAYWDVNAFRLGYGSDTEGPEQFPVVQGMTTTKERALQNLALRIPKFQHEAINGKTGMGAATWDKLNEPQQAAILSLVYNYGRLPKRVVVIPDDPARTAASIRALQGDNGGVNHKRRNAEADFYLVGATAPRPAPTAPIPHVPAPHAPPPVTPIPQVPAGLPPIYAGTAGVDAAIRDQLAPMRDALVHQVSLLNVRIAWLDNAMNDFGKLPGAAPPPPPQPSLLRKPESARPAAPPQRRPSVFGITNWATTFSALPAVFTAGVGIFNAISHGQAPTTEEWGVIGASVSAILIGINAKDKNVTGGTVPQTPEAARRVDA